MSSAVRKGLTEPRIHKSTGQASCGISVSLQENTLKDDITLRSESLYGAKAEEKVFWREVTPCAKALHQDRVWPLEGNKRPIWLTCEGSLRVPGSRQRPDHHAEPC